MPDLSRDLRRALESTIKVAREAAEAGAADALRRLGVFDARRPAHLDDGRNETRKRLRAHAKSLGDSLNAPDGEILRQLTEAAAYVQWHRLLFSRFLLERGLLRDEAGVALSLSDCREEAAMEGSGDEWSVSTSCTARMLPGVFPAEDPVEALVLAPEHAKALRDLLLKLHAAIFQADDSLGWTYQFWRAAEKKAINESGRKIGAAELPAVTQLFTEPYMVRFLLHNTLGAWWAGKVLSARPDLARDAADEDALRAACALPGYAWNFLRFVKENDAWRPAAGVFLGWPVAAAALTVLDPCCGSGHFLTEALAALAALRGMEEAFSPADAVVAVLRDNLAGLEIDGRCVQIAAFNVALAAWKIAGNPITMPTLQIAWVGAPPPLPRAEMAALGNGDAWLRRALEILYDRFTDARLLGSLMEVDGRDLLNADLQKRGIETLTKLRGAEPDRAEGAIAALGLISAFSILTHHFTLAITNPPFLGSGEYSNELLTCVKGAYKNSKGDLSTAFMERMKSLVAVGGAVGVVSKQEWCFLPTFLKFRKAALGQSSFNFFVFLGEEAWEEFGNRGPKATLSCFTKVHPSISTEHFILDVTLISDRAQKVISIKTAPLKIFNQSDQIRNPNSRISPSGYLAGNPLSLYANCFNGVVTGDADRFSRMFWELTDHGDRWIFQCSGAESQKIYSGMSKIIRWDEEFHAFIEERLGDNPGAWLRGGGAWGKFGVVVSGMRYLNRGIYTGSAFDNNCSVIVPKDPENLPAIWAFCKSDGYFDLVRSLNPKVSVTDDTFVQVPFDLAAWSAEGASSAEIALPEPYSDDPTQWLFHGHPHHATPGTELHVALGRMSGYRWPAEADDAMRLSTDARARIAEAATLPAPDADGLLALVPVLGERPLADRLRAFCVAAWGDDWTPNTEATLVAVTCERAKEKPPLRLTLDVWLRTHAARQHAKLFQDRPFLWWITDGRADGFAAIAHYHRLTTGNLERLAYTVLGDWIARLGGDPRTEAARVLQAKLALILKGDPPYDIFVRWKPLHAQPLGWELDLDDGVRLNIRPFIEAGVLVHVPNGIHYRTDRGKDVSSAPWFHRFNGERRNDHHTTLQEKQDARAERAAKSHMPA